jgi:chorismate-pyruvate lyase
VLEAWCAEHGVGHGAIRVQRVPAPPLPPDAETLDLLRPEPGEIPQHRRVVLMRGAVALSEAENWYLPQRLPPAMRDVLETTDLPFGVVVEPLRPTRRTLRAEPGAEGLLLRAVVLREGERPIAVVQERYLPALAPAALPASP